MVADLKMPWQAKMPRQTLALLMALSSPIVTVGTETLGCFHYNYLYLDSNITGNDNSAVECQARCQNTANCMAFTYAPATKQCALTSTAKTLVASEQYAPGGFAISGPASCPQSIPACSSEMPTNGAFPAATAALSESAWPSGTQPTNAQCWPRDPNTGYPVACTPLSVTVVEDHAKGWTAECNGLKSQTLPDGQTCEANCLYNPLCSVWANYNYTDQPPCWQGVMGQECYTKGAASPPTAAQRVMHGTYRVLKNLKGLQVFGLMKVFSHSIFADEANAIQHCRYYCIGALSCQYWQYSNTSGCWVESQTEGFRVKYPLVLAAEGASEGATYSGQAAASMVDGEYVQHLCSLNQGTTQMPMHSAVIPTPPPTPQQTLAATAAQTEAAESDSSSGGAWWMWMLAILILMLCGALAGVAIVAMRRKGSPRKTRSVSPHMSYATDTMMSAEQQPLTAPSYDPPIQQREVSVPPVPQPTARPVEPPPQEYRAQYQPAPTTYFPQPVQTAQPVLTTVRSYTTPTPAYQPAYTTPTYEVLPSATPVTYAAPAYEVSARPAYYAAEPTTYAAAAQPLPTGQFTPYTPVQQPSYTGGY